MKSIEKLLNLGFKKRNLFKGYDDYYLERDVFSFTYLVEKETDNFKDSFIQLDDSYFYLNTEEDFFKVFESDSPWTIAQQIGEK